MSTFSYAQAAKGASGTPTPSKTPSEPEKIDSKPEEVPTETTTETAPAPAEPEAPQTSEKIAVEETKDDDFTTVTNKHAAKKAVASRTSSPSVRTTSKSRKSKDDDSSNTPNGTTEATSEKQASTEGKTDAIAEKSSEKSEEAAKDAALPKELKAAPLPSINIWQQRREAQDAKVKTTPKSATGGKASSTKGASTADESQQDSKASKKKSAESAPEGTKASKKTESGKGRDAGSVPPVEDSTAWPTPQVAIGEEKKKAQEKTDKSPVIRPHGKEKWTPVPYVPTAVFNTPLPSAGGGRGGRRATRGGRDSGRGANGTGAAATDKAASGQAAQGKQATAERGRNEATGRAASLPAQSRRSTSTEAGATADARKASQAPERSRGARNGEDATKQVNGENAPRAQREGKAFGKNQEARNGKGGNLAVDSQAAARTNDRRFDAGSKSADPAGFTEFNRGEFRGERGGRGGNRGRGGFNNFNGQSAQFNNGAVSNNFAPSKSFGGFNDRQRSQQHGLPNGSQQNNRMPLRSPSLPNGNVYGVYPFPTDVNTMYGYQAVNPGPMSAVPYQPYMEPFSLMSMLSMQLEYYFSVDNMCKDMFLRKQMDSQGFVPLNVLASFKRVKSLTEDFELIRHVARQLRNVEYQTGEDNVDRLRPRDKWQQWVLPVDQREPAAQHTTPAAKNDENTPVKAINGSAPQFVPNGVANVAKTSLSSTAPEFMPSLPHTAVNEIANVGYPMDPYLSQDANSTWSIVSSSSQLPLDRSFSDSYSARGLDSHAESPSPLDLKTLANPVKSDTDRFRHQVGGATRSKYKDLRRRRYNQSKRMGRPSTETSNYAPQLSTLPSDEPFGEQGRSVTRENTPVATLPYSDWSRSLKSNFELNLYNEFRRSALDDLFTRHVDNGFKALMDFYRKALFARRIHSTVMFDMINLSKDTSHGCSTIAYDMIHDAIASGDMLLKNQKTVNKHFNTLHGNLPREKLQR
ncbi:hypothetical protein N7508_008085 [Penicillium antarcticum]|uniref:uncharacterized protein n=1 Tax=Penicillium antarcticum TaxID=416450 RepID=UPI00239B7A70|nr:uncharacterized protein N7508_008085 [Penicillium antarcticum]KAJ5297836.1 hypothetical protein N7508_008085 [Penicillium antarcticum]